MVAKAPQQRTVPPSVAAKPTGPKFRNPEVTVTVGKASALDIDKLAHLSSVGLSVSSTTIGGVPPSPGHAATAALSFQHVFNAQLLTALESPEIVEALAQRLGADRKEDACLPRIELQELEASQSVVSTAAAEARESLGAGMAELVDMMKDAPDAALNLIERSAVVELGKWLKTLREERGMTQAQLAEAAGTTAAQISVIEAGTGQRGVSIGLLARLAYGLGWKLAFAPT